jgi:N-acyl homoserine lactone hydrolase
VNWKISSLYFGEGTTIKDFLTFNLDIGLEVDIPYLGFLLQDGKTNLLFDTGISGSYIIDGKAWAGRPSSGGEKYVVESLHEKGLKPQDIDVVIYSHLHNDHAGNCHLFPHALHVFQKDEWTNLIDPLPSQQIRRDFDPAVIPILKSSNCLRVHGDLEFRRGLNLYKTPGHTAGRQLPSYRGYYPFLLQSLPQNRGDDLLEGRKNQDHAGPRCLWAGHPLQHGV